MKEKTVNEGQKSNACGLISLNAFNAMVKANTFTEIELGLKEAQRKGLIEYQKLLSNQSNKNIGEGIVLDSFFKQYSIKSNQPFVINPLYNLSKERLVSEFLKIKETWEDQESWETFSYESIGPIVSYILDRDKEALKNQYGSVTNFLWKASEQQILSIMKDRASYGKKLSFNELRPNQGFMFNNNGHIISLVYKIIESKNYYIYYNSASGIMRFTPDIKEAEAFILNNLEGQLHCHFCEPIMALTQKQEMNKDKSPSQQPSNIEELDQDIKKQKQLTFELQSRVQGKINKYGKKIRSIEIANQGQTKEEVNEVKKRLFTQLDSLEQEIKEDPDFIDGLKQHWGGQIPIPKLNELISNKRREGEDKAIKQLSEIETKEMQPITKEQESSISLITSEQIEDLINNRETFQDLKTWEFVNGELLSSIIRIVPENKIDSVVWNTINAQELCALIGIEYKIKKENSVEALPEEPKTHSLQPQIHKEPESPKDPKDSKDPSSLITSEPSKNSIKDKEIYSEKSPNYPDQRDEAELATKHRQAEEKRKREEFINCTAFQIDAVLDTLKDKIGTVSQHHYEEAYNLANQLLTDLNKAKILYLNDLKQMDKKIGDINKQFNAQCDTLINAAKPILERDLSWGNYLGNLLRAIARAIVWTATFGKVNTLFTPVRADLLKDVEETQSYLKPTEI